MSYGSVKILTSHFPRGAPLPIRIFGTIAVVVDLGFGGVDKFSRLPFRNHCKK